MSASRLVRKGSHIHLVSAEQNTKPDVENRYRQYGLSTVAGWLEPLSADFISAIARVQIRHHWHGALGEIGVHHGKLFILLQLNAAKDERLFAIDIFDDQALNIDKSGHGDHEIFLRNVAVWGGSTERLVVISKSSLQVAPNEILEKVGPVRLASIDGGHTEECALNDVHLVERVLADYGVAIIDDYFNPSWPGVSSGIAKYLMDGTSTLQPFAISPNKVYFARPHFASIYRRELKAIAKQFDKESVLFGYPVDIYGCRPPKRTISWHLKDIVKASAVGPYVLRAKAAIMERIHGSFSSRQ